MSPKAKPRPQPASSTRWLFERQPSQRFAELRVLTATEPEFCRCTGLKPVNNTLRLAALGTGLAKFCRNR